MLYWIPYAFVRISVFFIAGIFCSICFPDVVSSSTCALLLSLSILSYLCVFIFNRRKRRVVINPGFIGLFAILLAGYLNVTLTRSKTSVLFEVDPTRPITHYVGTVSEYNVEKPNSWKVVLGIDRIRIDDQWTRTASQVLVYLPKKDFPQRIKYGDALLIKGRPQEIPGPSNPGEFDQRTFLSYKGIRYQHFLKQKDVGIIGRDPKSWIMTYSLQARAWAESALTKVVSGDREQAIACALVLGITEGLDNELMGAYAATGAMHVLSVSGLHVGILYLLVMLLLKPFEKTTKGKWVVAAILLFLLWMYACITGLSPSVLRAVTMFSFMVIARPLGQRTNIYNVLAASAFLLLLVDPFLIMSVGFQLSYLAVAGIVYLQPWFYNLLEPSSKILDEVWKVTTVSIAAQASTFALGLLYFHQFPNYFLLSNLYVLPLGFVILTLGLAVLAVSFIPVIAALLGYLLEWSIKLLNYLIFLTESLPFSVIENVKINTFQCILLMAMVIGLILFVQQRKIGYVPFVAVAILLFSVSSWLDYQRNGIVPHLTVYKISGASAFDLIEPGRSFFFADSTLAVNESRIRFHIQPNRLDHYVHHSIDGNESAFVRSTPFGKLIHWNGKKILQLSAGDRLPEKELHVDFLILSHNSAHDFNDLNRFVQCQQIIVDSSNSFKFADKLLKDAALNNVSLHSVWHHGAFHKMI